MILDYRETLKSELEYRILNNPSYSLRSFARDLDIPAPRLSEILNFKCGTTTSRGRSIANRLNLSKNETEKFLLSIEAIHSRSPKKSAKAKEKLLEASRNEQDNFICAEKTNIISKWYHLAILELLTINNQDFSIEEIAKRLGINSIQAKLALHRLTEEGLVSGAKGKYVSVTDTSFTTTDIPSRAIKEHHEQHLKKAIISLYQDPVESREIASTTLAVDSSKVPELKKLVRDFRAKIASITDNSVNKDCVYLLGTQFFRLDKEI